MAVDVRIFDLAQRLVDCAQAELALTEAGDAASACVISGALAWDCECDGHLTVAINSTYPSSSFPTPTANTGGLGRCGQPYVVHSITVTMLRCVTGADDQGQPPACATLGAQALTAVIDASAVRNAIQCCLADALTEKTPVTGAPVLSGYQIGTQNMVGPAGGCAGSSLTVLVGFISRCPCD